MDQKTLGADVAQAARATQQIASVAEKVAQEAPKVAAAASEAAKAAAAAPSPGQALAGAAASILSTVPSGTLPADDTKKPWESVTMWAGVLTAIVPFIPGVGPAIQAFMGANPQIVSAVVGAGIVGLRAITQKKIVLK